MSHTGANELLAFTIENDGSLTNKRIFAKLDSRPDGICLDAKGAVWVGLFDVGKVERVLEGGEVTDGFTIPYTRTTAVALGGKDFKTLFVCVAPL